MIRKLRIASLVGVHILILAHIYLWGDEVIGSVDFQEFFHAFIKHGVINSGVIIVIIAFVTTLIFGRFFCGWACHFGAVQELAWWLLNKFGLKPITLNSSLVTILPLFILINFFILPNVFYYFQSPWEKIRIDLGMPEIWAFLPGFIIGSLTFLIDGFLIVYFLGRKGFCRFLCPWGSFLKLPNTLAFFKVRNIGGCIKCGNCTSNCPVGIDVSYEINNFDKVTNTNCTSCLDCIDGCPSNAIAYQWKNPIEEKFKLSYYVLNRDMYNLDTIKNKFKSIHKDDFITFLLILLLGFSIDGLYGMGHFLSFGIATITAIQIIKFYKKHIIISSIVLLVFMFHGLIKFSIWRGIENYEMNNYSSSIWHLERAIAIHPKPIGKFHVLLAQMYFDNNDFVNAEKHLLLAQKINPNHTSYKELFEKIKSKKNINEK
tara:strand:- start:310 stop:1599 length:1290 start_codon:yes stop_codon:yes gene_type:complete